MTTPPIQARVITVSNRASAGRAPDVSGPIAHQALQELGYRVETVIIPDGVDTVSQAITQAVENGARVIITTGGTGVTPLDLTPEGTQAVLERELPGISEAIRRKGSQNVATAVLSRRVAGTLGDSFIFNLPGSRCVVKDRMAVVAPLLEHILDQLLGGNHD